jgi:hypothetical protein
MNKTKASGIDFLRKQMKKKGSEFETEFVAGLSPEEARLYRTATASAWVDLKVLSDLLENGARKLYPGNAFPLCEFAREEGKFALSGFYKILFKVLSVSVLVEQTAKLWNIYYDQGVATVENISKNSGTLVVEDFSDLPKNNREIVLGYTIGALEIIGAKNIRSTVDESNPNRWKWIFIWL